VSAAPAKLRAMSIGRDGRLIFPWSRQPGESHQAFEAFETYRDGALGGTRSIRGTAEALGKRRQLLERWSARWRWVERCEHYDTALARLRQARTLAEVEEQARRAAEASEAARYIDVQGGTDELGRLTSDRDFLLCAGLRLDLDELAGLVGSVAEGVPLEGVSGVGQISTDGAPISGISRTPSGARGGARPRLEDELATTPGEERS
jgi:hypothetical protein